MFIVKLYAVHCTIGYYRIFYQKRLLQLNCRSQIFCTVKLYRFFTKTSRISWNPFYERTRRIGNQDVGTHCIGEPGEQGTRMLELIVSENQENREPRFWNSLYERTWRIQETRMLELIVLENQENRELGCWNSVYQITRRIENQDVGTRCMREPGE